nr:MAG TPA: hypothetical protein [Bacteriophage sp.]
MTSPTSCAGARTLTGSAAWRRKRYYAAPFAGRKTSR